MTTSPTSGVFTVITTTNHEANSVQAIEVDIEKWYGSVEH